MTVTEVEEDAWVGPCVVCEYLYSATAENYAVGDDYWSSAANGESAVVMKCMLGYAAGDGAYIAVESAETANCDLCCGAGYEKASICSASDE